MKLVTAAILWCLSSLGHADEYRYNLMATTGLPERVFDLHGKETAIGFSKDSAPQARFLLSKILELGGINGTKNPEEWSGVPFEQAIILRGSLRPEILRTASGSGTAEPESYQEFFLEDLLIHFPLGRHRPGKAFDTGFLETHFSFETLFPDGLEFDGKKIDFRKHTRKSERVSPPNPLPR